jgi:hypothetical protein
MIMLYRTKYNSSLLKHSVILALCFIFGLGCSQKSEDDTRLPLITEYIVDSVYLPISESDRQVRRIKEIGRGKYAPKELVAFVKDRNYKLYTYDVGAGVCIDSLPIAKFRNEYTDFYPADLDSLYLEQSNNTITGLFNGAVKIWNISPITTMIGRDVFIGYLSAYPLQVFGDTVICTTSTNELPGKGVPNIPFNKANHDVVFLLKQDTVQYLAKYNPNPDYFNKQDYYSSVEKAYINSNEIVYSYVHSDTMILHNFVTGNDKKMKLKTKYFFPNTSFDYNKEMDYKYITEYEMQNSRLGMGRLFYDNTQHRVYQLMHHKGRYIEANGRKNEFTDLAQSLFVLDEQLNQLKEVFIPPHTFAGIYFAFITHKGLYFAAHPSKQKYNDKMLFYRIVIR